jgi:methyl-accepting chemotaxis protein
MFYLLKRAREEYIMSNNKKGFRIGITSKLIGMAVIPTIVAMAILLVFAWWSLDSGLSTEAISGLELMAQATIAGYDSVEGDYYLDNDGNLWKGDTNLSENISNIDRYTEGTDADITICYEKTRKVTSLKDSKSGERIVDTEVSDTVWDSIKKGEDYTTTNIQINGEDYFACYVPLYNSDGSVVGIVFAGEPASDVNVYIDQKIHTIIIIAVIVMVIAVILGYFVSTMIAKCLVKTKDSLENLADGNLAITIDKSVLKRNDEIGEMGSALENLVGELRTIVTHLKDSADTLYQSGNTIDDVASQSSSAADEISNAVEDISKGAVSQAEEIQNASMEINTMGSVIESIVDNVGDLTTVSHNMSDAGDASMTTMHELSDSNDRTTASITRIAEQIQLTNNSIQKISEAAELITFITDQTSLLALNASIESARAGEAGKGFAVVATEIQNLAVQSEEAAKEIQKVIKLLQSESEQTIQIMDQAQKLVKEQQEKLEATKTRFTQVSNGINQTRENTDVIHGHTNTCDEARVHVMDVIANLSDISQQNAASAQQTTASMQELNSTVGKLSDSARNLKKLSADLNKEMEFFKL